MGKRFLIDTNTLIYYLKASLSDKGFSFLNKVLDEEPIISVITQIELLGYPSISNLEESYANEIINASTIISLSHPIVLRTIILRKEFKIKIPDAIIAATAVENGLVLITSNQKDFAKIFGLEFIDPVEL